MNDEQARLLSMYKDVSEVLESHGIPFYLCYGSALGAVRHDGFIPWDDDIDLAVWEKDLPRIDDAMTQDLDSNKYYWHFPSADTHPHVILKTEDFEDDLKNKRAPFIDLFVLSDSPSTKVRSLLIKLPVAGIHLSATVVDHISSIRLHKCLAWTVGVFQRLADMICNKDTPLSVIRCAIRQNDVFPKEWWGEPIMHRFEDTDVPLPKEYDAVLTQLYGNYMTPPPEGARSGATGYPCSVYKDYVIGKNGK